MPAGEDFTIGVEEEFFLVDPGSRRLAPVVQDILPGARTLAGGDEAVQSELLLSQIETGTEVCHSLAEVRGEVERLRRSVAAAAADAGCAVASTGTHPLDSGQGSGVTPKAAYLRLEHDYRLVTREQQVCGCHVHVGVTDPEVAIQVTNAVRPWLGVLLALSANSPFWNGEDTGYASYRNLVWRRWPTAGPPDVFASRAAYDELVHDLLMVDAIDDPARIYWDVRPSARFDTVELRVADACLTVDDTVTIAGLVRALVRTCHRRITEGRPVALPRAELVRAATWRAARYGLDGTLVDVEHCRSRPAAEAVRGFMELVRPALEQDGDWEEVEGHVRRIVWDGNGAVRQRRAFAERGRLDDVVDLVVAQTCPGQ